VTRFCAAMERLGKRDDALTGMAPCLARPGLGKTRTALWWAVQNGGSS
jgi:hypothetical protein